MGPGEHAERNDPVEQVKRVRGAVATSVCERAGHDLKGNKPDKP